MDLRTLHYLKAFGYSYISEKKDIKCSDLNFYELSQSIGKCTLCHYSKLRKKKLYQDEIKNAKLMIYQAFIDKEENESGKLFASKEKKELLVLCKDILNLNENEIYLSYMLKCFSNFELNQNALDLCLPYFFDELRLINPSMILCLGKEAFKSLGFVDFDKYRGECLKLNEKNIIVSYDLRFLSKNPSFYADFIEDIKKIKGYL